MNSKHPQVAIVIKKTTVNINERTILIELFIKTKFYNLSNLSITFK